MELVALSKAIELRGFDWDYQKRAQCYEERGDYDNAIAGQAYLKKGDTRAAMKCLNKAKRLKNSILPKKRRHNAKTDSHL